MRNIQESKIEMFTCWIELSLGSKFLEINFPPLSFISLAHVFCKWYQSIPLHSCSEMKDTTSSLIERNVHCLWKIFKSVLPS